MAVVRAEDVLEDVGEFPFELTAEELPNACRRAYLRIIVGADRGWGKAELARWLAGPYRRLTIFGEAAGVPRRRDSFSDLTPVPSSAGVSELRVGKLLDGMRDDVLIVMRELMAAEGRAAFTTLATDIGLVALAQDPRGTEIAIPCVRERMSLVDRVLSLVAADALARSEDFEHSLFVCARCHQPVFDVHARANGICRVHVSGVGLTSGGANGPDR